MKGKKKMFLKFKLLLLRASAFPRRKDKLKKRKWRRKKLDENRYESRKKQEKAEKENEERRNAPQIPSI